MCFPRSFTRSAQNNQQNQDALGNLLNKMAAWILFICVAVSASSVAFFSFGRAILNEEKDVAISYVFQIDTLGAVSPQSRALADSVLNEMSKHEQRIADKYEYIIEQRSNMEDYLTWGGILLTVVVSVFGFFGYKSLHDIQERIVKLVEPSAQKAAEDKADSVCKNSYEAYETTANAKIEAWKTSADAEIKNYKSATLTALQHDLKEAVDKKSAKQMHNFDEQIKSKVQEVYNQQFAEKVQDIENNAATIDGLQQEITDLKSRIDEMSVPLSAKHEKVAPSKRARRSLQSIDPDPMNPKKS